MVARACTFSCVLCRLPTITASFDWFTGLSPSFLISQSNYFGLGFTTLYTRLKLALLNIQEVAILFSVSTLYV